jgi:hypothetical protein
VAIDEEVFVKPMLIVMRHVPVVALLAGAALKVCCSDWLEYQM